MTAPRHLLSLFDLERDALAEVLDRGAWWRQQRGRPDAPRPCAGRSVAIVFEKPSTRTRLSFEVAVHEMGGHPLVVQARDTQLGRGETLEDTARTFGAYVHALVLRTHAHQRLEILAAHAGIPVVNALSDDFHPCQLVADLMTVRAHTGGRLEGVRVAWVGDGNNVAHDWIAAAARTGIELVLACPPGYEPAAHVVDRARSLGARVELVTDPDAACRGADVVTTDVWASMGQEAEAEARRRAFEGWTVDAHRMRLAAPHAIFLHCLPAHRGEEVAAEVIDGPWSRVWEQAENRLHGQKAILEHVMRL
ncbi:MAG: ornithine carbamoyltransferase [Myxococcota bacterium]|nr:ornithine carbamoyltransferase [Myxococcota bacterium]MDW8361237.1 ornithine carbamoyltransferase [Myxococcales bacterium]